MDETGRVTSITVEDNSRTAHITLDTGGTFRLTNDNDTSFNAMLSVCSAARVSGTPVTLTHDSGNSEVDTIKI